MNDPAAVEQALSTVLDRFAGSLKKELLRELGSGVGGPGTSALCVGFSRITGSRNQTDIMQALLEAADTFSGRCAVLVVKGDRLTGWRARGFDEGTQGRLRQLNLAPDGNAGWKQMVESSGAMPEPLAQTFFEALGTPSDHIAYLIPLLFKERPVAMLYTDVGQQQPLDLAALELLTRSASMWLEISVGRPKGAEAAAAAVSAAAPATAEPAYEPPPPAPEPEEAAPPPPPPPRPAEAAPARPARPTGPDLTNIPAAEHDAHKKAFRFAKLLVDELQLYNKDKITEGRSKRDVYSLLQEDIDKSRLAYEKKFANTPAGKVDYFHQLMVQIVGEGDAGVLGSGFAGPSH